MTARKISKKAAKGPQDILAALAAGKPAEAVRIAAGFPHLGQHKDRITKGWSAHRNPEFYRELGLDPAQLFADAVQAVRERYEPAAS